MIRATRPLLIVLAIMPLPSALHAQEGLALSPAGALPAFEAPTKTRPRPRSQARAQTKSFDFRRAEAKNLLAMGWTCVGCSDRSRPGRPDAEDRSRDPNDTDEPVIVDPAQAPVIE